MSRIFYGRDIKGTLPLNYALGQEWIDDKGHKCISVLHAGKATYTTKPETREVELKTVTYVGGYAAGAMHYYARIHVRGPLIWDTVDNAYYSCGGYGKNKPENLDDLSFDAERRVTKVERDMSDEIIAKVGETTTRHNTHREAIFAGLKFIKAKFGPGWVMNFRDEVDTFGFVNIPVKGIAITP